MISTRRPQRTIGGEAVVRGVSFLEGRDVQLRFRPAEPDTGVVFVRTDLPDRPTVPAHVKYVVPRQRRTTIQRGAAIVEMVEHVMAALAGLEVDNCIVEIDGPETPGCDGSSLAFVEAIQAAGVVEQDRPKGDAGHRPAGHRPRGVVGPRRPSRRRREAGPGLSPRLRPRDARSAPRASLSTSTPETFRDRAGVQPDLPARGRGRGPAQGRDRPPRTTEADLLIFGPDGPIGNELRYPDECVRHKILDLVGDLALLDRDLAGHVVAHRSGHQLNAELVPQAAARGRGPAAATHSPQDDRAGDGYRGYPGDPAASLSVPAGRPRARARAGATDRGVQERHVQRAVLPGPLAGPADHARRADRRGPGPGRRHPDRRAPMPGMSITS